MADIKPIETKYNGYRFRSRLEARYAVFFDSLELKFEYELEGYKLPSGRRYLPDFFIPSINLFVEVKPHDKIPYDDMLKMLEFVTEGDKHLLLIIGTPGQEWMCLMNRRSCPSLSEWEWESDDSDIPNFTKDDEVAILIENFKENWGVHFGVTPFELGWTLVYSSPTPIEDFRIKRARLEARQARFEFGESG